MKFRSALRIFSVLLVVLLVALGLSVLNSFKRFDLHFNPIVSKIRNDPSARGWGDRVALIPAQFASGEPREVVVEKLNNAGFELTTSSQAWGQYQNEVNLGQEVFTRETSRFPCNIRMYVFIAFDNQGDLTFAQGTQHEQGCL